MQADRFTIKSQEALQAAIAIAAARHHTETQPEHLLLALLEQPESVVGPVLRKLGAQTDTIRRELNAALDAKPTITAGANEPSNSRELLDVLRAAEREAGKLRDEYISTEHILLALTGAQGGEAAAILKRNGATHKDTLQAIESVRGPHRVTDQSPEDKYQALQKFGNDLTAAAEDGKLDPVIGRDDEIRRVIQVLSRRTEQPCPDRRARRRQDRDRRGSRRGSSAATSRVLRDRKVISLDIAPCSGRASRRVRGARRPSAGDPDAEGPSSCSWTSCTRSSPARRRRRDASNLSADARPRRRAPSARPRSTSTRSTSRRTPRSSAASSRSRSASRPSRTRSRSSRPEGRYEAHHGVTIIAALIAAATLSHRNIADRFRFDKAIDLVDEAASRVSIELSSVPTEIDEVERRIKQLEIERSPSPRRPPPTARPIEPSHELREQAPACAQWERRRSRPRATARSASTRRAASSSAERELDYQRAAELRHGDPYRAALRRPRSTRESFERRAT
jgi:ATP-dependent Clp protease ATP-binding subunit ClpB